MALKKECGAKRGAPKFQENQEKLPATETAGGEDTKNVRSLNDPTVHVCRDLNNAAVDAAYAQEGGRQRHSRLRCTVAENPARLNTANLFWLQTQQSERFNAGHQATDFQA